MIGENPVRAIDLDIQPDLEPMLTPPLSKIFQTWVDKAGAHILQAQARQKYYADRKRKEEEYEVGEEVWLSTRFIKPDGNTKFQGRYIGPLKIIERIGKVAYKLDLPLSMNQHPVFHVSLLCKNKPRPEHMMPNETWSLSDENNDGDVSPTYEVDYIMDSTGTGNNERFLVKWKGFPEADATWEPEENLSGSLKTLRAFRRGRNRRRRQLSNVANCNTMDSTGTG